MRRSIHWGFWSAETGSFLCQESSPLLYKTLHDRNHRGWPLDKRSTAHIMCINICLSDTKIQFRSWIEEKTTQENRAVQCRSYNCDTHWSDARTRPGCKPSHANNCPFVSYDRTIAQRNGPWNANTLLPLTDVLPEWRFALKSNMNYTCTLIVNL